jgi:hypothetical protein
LDLETKFCLVAVLFMFFSLIAIASVLVTPVEATDPVIVGKWDRTDGADVYTIYADHTTQTVLTDGTHHGTWEYDGSSGYNYIFHWEHSPPGQAPFIDYVTVAADGQSYSGYNNYGDHFHCVRIGDAPAAESGGFPIIPVAIGGGIAAIAAGGAAAYYFFIAKHGAESAASGAAASGDGGSAINKEQNTLLQDDRELAQNCSMQGENLQSPVTENKQYSSQERNSDLSSSRKIETVTKASNQPGQVDSNSGRLDSSSVNRVRPAIRVDSDKGETSLEQPDERTG